MDSQNFRLLIKELENKFISINNLPIRIWYSTIEKETRNRIMPYRYSGLNFGFQEVFNDHYTPIKNFKTVYNTNKRSNQYNFWSEMIYRIEKKVDILIKENLLKEKI